MLSVLCLSGNLTPLFGKCKGLPSYCRHRSHARSCSSSSTGGIYFGAVSFFFDLPFCPARETRSARNCFVCVAPSPFSLAYPIYLTVDIHQVFRMCTTPEQRYFRTFFLCPARIVLLGSLLLHCAVLLVSVCAEWKMCVSMLIPYTSFFASFVGALLRFFAAPRPIGLNTLRSFVVVAERTS